VGFFIDNILLFLLAIGSFFVLAWPWIAKKMNAARELEPLEVVKAMNKPGSVVVDTRPVDEFYTGHLLGAKNIPVKDFGSSEAIIKKIKNKPIVLVAASTTKAVASLISLRKMGCEDITILAGGMHAWQQANLPTETKK
tara:strand:+ start:146 stop:562 length:417 start_codon:yes stop_codon:yes gene_type:complete